jgi:hypothetical protein
MVEFCRMAWWHFLWAPFVCGFLYCPTWPQAKQRTDRFSGARLTGRNVTVMFRPAFEGSNWVVWGGRTVQPLWGQIATKCKCFWIKLLQCQMVRVGVSQYLNGDWGGLMIIATQQGSREKYRPARTPWAVPTPQDSLRKWGLQTATKEADSWMLCNDQLARMGNLIGRRSSRDEASNWRTFQQVARITQRDTECTGGGTGDCS